MIEHEIIIRPGYSDTDQMGYVHHSNYARFYENARWELFRTAGVSYLSLEKAGFMLPVISMQFEFYKPAYYDEELRIITTLKEIKGTRIFFMYHTYNGEQDLINKADVILAFVKMETRKPCPPPFFVLEKLNLTFEKSLS